MDIHTAILAAALLAAGLPAQALPPDSPAPAGLCVKGRAVSVSHAGSWYPARVLDGPDRMGTCLVSYDGYGSNWDEWVGPARLRPATTAAGAPAADRKAPSAASALPGSVPPGRYGCYTFDSGQLQYAHTEVRILDARRYAVGERTGTYTLSADGTLRFTGPMANAAGRLSRKSTGRWQIGLVFNGDARASMTCPAAG